MVLKSSGSLAISDRVFTTPCKDKLCVNPDHLKFGDEARFWNKVQKLNEVDGCWIWIGGEDKNGYGKFSIKTSAQPYRRAHRYAWELYIGRTLPSHMVVCHKCDNPRCVRPDHLFLGEAQDNSTDMVSKDRQASGEDCARSKLTENEVIKIRELYKSGMTQSQLSDQYGLTQSNISAIVLRKTWRHI